MALGGLSGRLPDAAPRLGVSGAGNPRAFGGNLVIHPRLFVLGRRRRIQRIHQLIDELGRWEEEGRGILASLQELTDPDDDLAVEVARLVAALDG